MQRRDGCRRQRIAVVGSGISGLATAWLLGSAHDVTLYEQDARLGGHSNTVDVSLSGTEIAVDTGFIVYNPASYPNLTALFEHLSVETAPSSMSFAVSLDKGACEYSGAGLMGLFGQPANLMRASHWMMAAEIARFFRLAQALTPSGGARYSTLGDWLARHRFSRAFVERHIAPMGAAIWSSPSATILDFPARSFVRFFENHGLLKILDRPQWRTVRGGSRNYVERMLAGFRGRVVRDTKVTRVKRQEQGGVLLTSTAGEQSFDHVVLACHADQALALLDDADTLEHRVLKAFRFTANEAVLHCDSALMPRRRRLWSSWNFVGSSGLTGDLPCVTYWMNRLQPLGTDRDVFVTLNPRRSPESVLWRTRYEHPVFDGAALAAQNLIPQIQGRRGVWFAGAWCGYGFHEDGLQSAVWVAERLGVRRPWTTGELDRLYGGAEEIISRPHAAAEAASP